MAMATPALYEPVNQIRVLGEGEHELRALRSRTVDHEEQLLRWTRLLELSLLFVSIHEAVHRLGLRTVDEIPPNITRIDELVITLSHLDPVAILRENESVLRASLPPRPAPGTPLDQESDEVVRSVRSLLLHLPAKLLLAVRPSQPQLAHRCQLAIDGIRAFIARHAHPNDGVLRVIGQAYADGRLSIDEVANALEVAVTDAVALLEEHGFRRSVDKLRLTDEVRERRLKELRADRVARGGVPVIDEKLVARDVAASQRIEDIDARPWLPR